MIEVLVALVIVGLAVAAVVQVFGNGVIGEKVASDAQTALALAEEQLTLATTNTALRPGIDKGAFAGRFAWRTTVSRFIDDKDTKMTADPDGPLRLYRVVVDVDWSTGRHSQTLTLSTLRLSTVTP